MLSLKKMLTKILQKLKSMENTIVEYTATTGTELYAGWYYANITLNQSNPSAISIIYSQNNRPAFAQLVNNGLIRVYTNQANVQVRIRCLYCPTS